jgi:D-aspartate ligase
LASPAVIVISGNENALSIARSLARIDVQVHALSGTAYLSKSSHIQAIDYQQDELNSRSDQINAWIKWLLGSSAQPYHGSVLVACNDVAVEMIAKHRGELSQYYLLEKSRDDLTLALLDKVRTYELAEKIGIEAPKTWIVENEDEMKAALTEIKFPCAIKPRHSVAFWQLFKTKLLVVNSREELKSQYARAREAGIDVLLTEVIPGGEDQYFSHWTYVNENGNPLFHFTKRKFRQYPIYNGLGTFHRSYHDEETRDLGTRFVRDIGLRGIAVTEFKRDIRDNRLKLMECNVRFTKSSDIIVRSGIDLPKLIYGEITGIPQPIATEFREGVGLWWPKEDFAAFRQYRRNNEMTWLQWILSISGKVHLPIFSLRDSGPSITQATGWLKNRKARKRKIL